MNQTADNSVTIAHQAIIMAVDEAAVPVINRDRQLPRKELAAMVRKLFRQLGIKGVSVTTPNYSMAKGIDITWPRRDDTLGADGYHDPESAASKENGRTLLKIQEIMARACPYDDDRSDSQTDYFDPRIMFS